MKKATILMVLVLLLSFCGVGVLAADIFEAHDQVMLTEKVIYGDRSKANGLTARIDSHYHNQVFWNTSLTLSEVTESNTEYRFSAKPRRETHPVEYEGINIYNDVMGLMSFEVEEPQDGLWVAYKELFDETEPGKEGKRDVLLKDYMSHYPIGFTLDFPNTILDTGGIDRELWNELDAAPGSEAYIVQRVRDYFRIPVPEDEHLKIHVRKQEDGMLGSWGGDTSRYGDSYNMRGYSVLSDNACYFTFETLTEKGNTIDTSELPDGYGIYRLPYHMEYNEQQRADVSIIEADNLEMVYPLTPGMDITCLSLNAAQTCLYLHAVEDGTYTITVIDISTMKPKQKLDVIHFDEEPSWAISDQDDFMVIEFYRTQELAVISKAQSGELTLEYICPMQPEGVNAFSSYRAAMDFDGERLVLAQQLDIEYEHELDYRDRTSCSIQVAVYEEDGLSYLGEYSSSLDTGENWANHSFYVRGNNYDPVDVTWAG